jgi:hypothetical protein
MRTRCGVAFGAVLIPMLLAQQKQSIRVRQIDVVILNHVDVGFTDQSYMDVNELQRR